MTNENANGIDAGSQRPSKPVIELLDTAPLAMRRPLALIDGYAYAAIWPHVKTTSIETVDQQGKTIRHSQPVVKVEQQLCIVRSDGVTFGYGDKELSDLGLEVRLPEIPPDKKLWSSRGVKAFVKGERPNPSEVFRQIVDVVDRFIDFDRSIADQRTMSEMIACYIIATWFLEAFTVIGFIWPNGERGSGKTQLLNLIAELSYLGQLILAGGSYATLRDLADYGATLCFDDAENLSDARRTDPDKRALLLAGNRRGAMVTVKEPSPDGRKWQTRYVNAFCPRAFSAIRLPDEVLSSRTIIVPLVRTGDRQKANVDPLDYTLWPHDRRMLIDSLWGLALAHLQELRPYEAQVNQRADLTGRDLEPWRGILAVGLWLEDKGVAGLFKRMAQLSVSYQSERQRVEACDPVLLVIRALCKCLGCDIVTLRDLCDVASESNQSKTFILTADIAAAASTIAEEDELDITLDAKRIGHMMRKQRFEHGNQPGTHKKGWKVSKQELARFVKTFGLGNDNFQ